MSWMTEGYIGNQATSWSGLTLEDDIPVFDEEPLEVGGICA